MCQRRSIHQKHATRMYAPGGAPTRHRPLWFQGFAAPIAEELFPIDSHETKSFREFGSIGLRSLCKNVTTLRIANRVCWKTLHPIDGYQKVAVTPSRHERELQEQEQGQSLRQRERETEKKKRGAERELKEGEKRGERERKREEREEEKRR